MPASPPRRTRRNAPPIRPPTAFAPTSASISPPRRGTRRAGALLVILSRRPDIERFLDQPTKGVRAALIHGRDRGQVHERADRLAAVATARPDDPFDVARLAEADIDRDASVLDSELSAQSLGGGRRLVRLKLTDGRAPIERAAAEALKTHAEGGFNPDAFFLIEAGELGR